MTRRAVWRRSERRRQRRQQKKAQRKQSAERRSRQLPLHGLQLLPDVVDRVKRIGGLSSDDNCSQRAGPFDDRGRRRDRGSGITARGPCEKSDPLRLDFGGPGWESRAVTFRLSPMARSSALGPWSTTSRRCPQSFLLWIHNCSFALSQGDWFCRLLASPAAVCE